jgi:hypothetical protein
MELAITLLAIAVFLLVGVLMHIFKVSLVYIGTDEAKYDKAMFGILLRK